MQSFNSESEQASIVFVGSFNPAIFHPEWFVRNELIPQDDLKGAQIEIVHQDISKFSLEWLGIDVLRNKFVARTQDPSKFTPLKDLMFSAFKILYHTPITQLGMNLDTTYRIEEEDSWHRIGDTLVPKQIWEESLPKRIGMTSLTVQSPRPDSLKGFIRVTVSPVPLKGRDKSFGVSFNVNSHVELISDHEGEETDDVPSILAQHWDNSLSIARKISQNTITKAIEK